LKKGLTAENAKNAEKKQNVFGASAGPTKRSREYKDNCGNF
jgi:hypothetical protein